MQAVLFVSGGRFFQSQHEQQLAPEPLTCQTVEEEVARVIEAGELVVYRFDEVVMLEFFPRSTTDCQNYAGSHAN